MVAPQDLEHHRPAVLRAPRAVEDGVCTLVQDLQHAVTRTIGHRKIVEAGAASEASASVLMVPKAPCFATGKWRRVLAPARPAVPSASGRAERAPG